METKNLIIEALVAALEIPPGAYDKAHDRYKDLGDWFCDGSLKANKPRIYAQGSFRLGTVIRPLHYGESYDLDVGCRLETGITKHTHTQENLKTLVGDELEAYRKARQIKKELQEKPRCWCLEYADELRFSEDIVPSIPEEMTKQASLAEAMVKHGLTRGLAEDVSHHSGNITDNRRANYRYINPDWRISNSEGYAKWFEFCMESAAGFMERVAVMAKQAKVEKLPAWKWKTPLQKAIQFLKRHRDSMFAKNSKAKPISIILTTLAAAAYRGEENTISALDRILADMDRYILPTIPRVPNPVNPNEDFADKWNDPKYADLNLEGNFQSWLKQARTDFQNIEKLNTEELIHKFTLQKFGLRIPQDEVAKILPLLPSKPVEFQKIQVITQHPARPWRM
jgi:hypothetical protein